MELSGHCFKKIKPLGNALQFAIKKYWDRDVYFSILFYFAVLAYKSYPELGISIFYMIFLHLHINWTHISFYIILLFLQRKTVYVSPDFSLEHLKIVYGNFCGSFSFFFARSSLWTLVNWLYICKVWMAWAYQKPYRCNIAEVVVLYSVWLGGVSDRNSMTL